MRKATPPPRTCRHCGEPLCSDAPDHAIKMADTSGKIFWLHAENFGRFSDEVGRKEVTKH